MSIINQKIRVLVVDDSMVARGMIMQGLSAHPRIEVIGYAINTMDAKTKIAALKPDVVTMDVEMPGKSGPEFLREYIPQHPVPVILVSSLNLRVFDALDAGAVDFVQKPQNHGDRDVFITALTQKVIIAASAKVRMAQPAVSAAASSGDVKPFPPLGPNPVLNNVLIGLGASTGGTEATLEVMKRLPEDIPGMVIVQHMPKGFTQMYRGLALVAPADLQARVVRIGNRYTLSCVPGEKVSGHRPSVDAMFQSMSETVQCKMVGIIMTGMGQDGAAGLLAMRKKGAYTIGQDKASSVVYGMPMVAHEIGAVCTQASCEDIAGVLIRHLKALH